MGVGDPHALRAGGVGPYHLVWPRDFYHVATAQRAAGDEAAPLRMLEYLWRVQKRDGSWWQNTRVDGRRYWTQEQMDQVALPIVLAWWLGRTQFVRLAWSIQACAPVERPAIVACRYTRTDC